MRQLWDIQQGTRKGHWSPLMKQVVAKLTQDDMLNLAAYVASLGRGSDSDADAGLLIVDSRIGPGFDVARMGHRQ